MARPGPTIIVRKKVTAPAAHHGGAWKVAYADFVTAMMAFFLLMWLLNATTEQQRKGLADYFAPDIPLSRTSGGADGMLGGTSPTARDAAPDDGTATGQGIAGDLLIPDPVEPGSEAAQAAEVASLQTVEDVLLGRGGESLLSDEALAHVVTRLTEDGLVIEIFALPDAPIFDGATPRPVTAEILAAVARLSAMVTNRLAVGDHVPARPVMRSDVDPWGQSAARAEAAREALLAGGLPPLRLARATAHADRTAAAADPAAPRNDRIEVTFLRRDRDR